MQVSLVLLKINCNSFVNPSHTHSILYSIEVSLLMYIYIVRTSPVWDVKRSDISTLLYIYIISRAFLAITPLLLPPSIVFVSHIANMFLQTRCIFPRSEKNGKRMLLLYSDIYFYAWKCRYSQIVNWSKELFTTTALFYRYRIYKVSVYQITHQSENNMYSVTRNKYTHTWDSNPLLQNHFLWRKAF